MDGLMFLYYYSDCEKVCAMSSFVANLNLNSQDVEEGQLPDDANQQPLIVSLPPNTRPNGRSFHDQQHLKDTRDPCPEQTHPPAQLPTHTPHDHAEIVYETIKHKTYTKEYSYSPDPKKKTHKSHHKSSKHHHNSNDRDRSRQRQKNKNDRKQKEKELYPSDKKINPNLPADKDDPNLQDSTYRQNGYPPPPYYPPYMYPPMPMMPHHMPPHMFPYPMPPPYMPPGSYHYPPNSMMPPMAMPPPNYQHPNSNQGYINSSPHQNMPPFRGPGQQGAGMNDNNAQKLGENGYKMFTMPSHYMYPYPPPPMGYPGYPPPPYMMYPPPEVFEGHNEVAQTDDQQKVGRRKQFIDNQKQRIKKTLKHFSSETKIQILQTIRNLIKLDKKTPTNNHPQPLQSYPITKETETLRGQISQKCYENSLIKVDRWLNEEDSRLRDTVAQLIVHFQLDEVRNRIDELKRQRKGQLQKNKSQMRRLLDRLIVSHRQVIF